MREGLALPAAGPVRNSAGSGRLEREPEEAECSGIPTAAVESMSNWALRVIFHLTPPHPCWTGTSLPILQVRELRHREVKGRKSHTTGRYPTPGMRLLNPLRGPSGSSRG